MDTKSLLSNTFQNVSDHVELGYDLTRQRMRRLTSNRVCVGVTGLSRSGKSTFITSLINQLIQHESASLSGFSASLSGQFMGVKTHKLEDSGLNAFPYAEAMAELSATPPRWPESTVDISGCLLELKFKNRKGLLRSLTADTRSIFVEIRDYPGEWLLDLPLMDMTYAAWCAQCVMQFTQEPRVSLLGDLLAQLQTLDPLMPYDEVVATELRRLYVQFLKDCKNGEHALSLIQPGRFLIPGEFAGDEALNFIPLLGCASCTQQQLESADENSYYKVFEQRYNRYTQKVVVPFYKQFFRPVDRQVVLVDVINALHGGPEYINDMREALSNISDSFSYGRHSALAQLFSPRIEQVIYAATKVDQVVAKDHESVRQLLGALVREALSNAAYEGVNPTIEAIASVRSSIEIQDHGDAGISGFDTAGHKVGYVHPNIPDRVPSEEDYTLFRDWKIPVLNPPKGVGCETKRSIPHIRLDSILERLIGDVYK